MITQRCKPEFDTKVRYDQSGIVMYLDSENWLKAAVEYENEDIQRLGSVVTNNGYSDWASVDVDASIKCKCQAVTPGKFYLRALL